MNKQTIILGDIVKISKGKKHNIVPMEESKFRYINIEDLHGGNEAKYTDEIGTIVSEDDIIIAWDGANAGKVGVGFNGLIGSTLARLSLSSNEIDPRFLFWYLDSNFELIKSQRTGATIPHVNGNALKEIRIPLSTLETQKRIAEILDKADALRQKDQQLLKKYDELAQAIFIDMFGDPVKNEKGWEKVAFADLFESRLGKMLDAKKQNGGMNYKYLGNSNLQWFRFDLRSLSEMKFEDNEIEKFQLKYGDILICEGGEVGRSAIWKEEQTDVFFQKAIHRARIKSGRITPEYTVMLFWFLANFGGLKDYVTAATISHLTGEKLKTIQIPTPPYELQLKYTEAILQLDNQRKLFNVSFDSTQFLFQSLIQQAFKGELVSEKPATVLV